MAVDDGLFLTVTLILVAVIGFLVFFVRRERSRANEQYDFRMHKQSAAFQLGASQKVGDFSQILGTFSVLTDYDEVLMLSSTSAQSSLDLLGMKDKAIDFIEFKKDGAALSKGQKKLRTLIESGEIEVHYKVLDVKLPDGTEVKARGYRPTKNQNTDSVS